MTEFLFDIGHQPTDREKLATLGAGRTPRLRTPQRQQMVLRSASLDQLLDPEHRVRLVWEVVCQWDLSAWLKEIKAVAGHVGRDATDPRLLVALWVFATLEGIGSARELARLCQVHLAYQWLCGEVTVNHNLLAEFRAQQGAAWHSLLTQIVGTLLHTGLVSLNRVAQDGMKVRASAGKGSFRRRPTLEKCWEEAREQLAELQRLADECPQELSQRQQAARQRAAAERLARVEESLQQCDELQAQRDARAETNGKPEKPARASTTDPAARTIQFSDGGYRPGYNVQYATDTGSGIIVGVEVTNAGNDAEQLPPMLEQLRDRYGLCPAEALVDGGYATKQTIEAADQQGCVVFAPLKEEAKQRAAGKDPHARKKGDSDAVASWRERMGTELAKAIYKLRSQTAEWVNALARNRGFLQMPVRGPERCGIIAVLFAIAHNLVTQLRLTTETG